ncbi:P11 protein [Echinococcus multilocularis]|uniref:p11 protein n=1 Tax=Echinococcus multilocularis TaxID=6211 RepID=A0A068Y2L6_ECHMU|nr:P11 protein [Echinococcus multilocularis]
MPEIVARMYVHSLRSSKTHFTTEKQSHAEMLAQKIVDMLPRSSMSRSVFRSLGIECNVDNSLKNSGPLLCITGTAHSLPNLVKRACSPTSVFLNSPTSVPQPEPERSRLHDRSRQSVPNRILTNMSASQENTPPSLKRSAVRPDANTSTSAPCGVANRRGIEPRVLRPRVTLSSTWNQRTISRSSSSPKHGKLLRRSSPCILYSSSNYYQTHFDIHSFIPSEDWARKQIEVPSWRINDVITERCGGEAGVSRVLRSRNSQLTRTQPLKRSCPPEDYEDTSDGVYMSRHARLETHEIKRERLSDQRTAEEELRLRIEWRERESWRKRQATRVDSFMDIDPERFMPTSLLEPISKVRYIHVRSDIPVIAFGVKVPKPEFGSFSLP